MPENTKNKLASINQLPLTDLLCIEELIEVLVNPVFDNLQLIILTDDANKRRKILPTLSLLKNEKSTCEVIDSIDHLYNFIDPENRDKKSKDLKEIIKFSRSKGYKPYRYKKKCVTILSKNENKEHLKFFYSIISCADKIKYQSLNFINDLIEIAVSDMKHLDKILKPNADESFSIFCDFIRNRFNIKLFECKYVFSSNEWDLLEKIQEYSDDSKKIIKDRFSKITTKKSMYGKLKDEYFVILPFINRRKTKLLKHAILLFSKKKINAGVISNIIRYINYYFDNYLEKQKLTSLTNLQEKTISLQFSEKWSDTNIIKFTFEKEIVEFLDDAFSYVINFTNAFSVTIRLYEPHLNQLRRIYEKSTENVIRNIPSNDTETIPLKSNNYSINVRAFNNCIKSADGKRTHIYIHNIKEYVKKFIKRKIQHIISYLYHRENSRSEICFPLYFKKTKIGVINFESPLSNGFKDDKDYLNSIITSIENYLALLMELNDKHWLSKRSKIYQNLHELENIINLKNFPENYRTEIKNCIVKHDISISESCEEIGDLILFKEQYVKNYRNALLNNFNDRNIAEKLSKNFDLGCKLFFIDKELKIPKTTYDIITIIYRNLLDNYKNHCDTERDTLAVYQKSSQKRFLNFKLKSYTIYDPFLIKKYLFAPVKNVNDDFRNWHYGLFIAGMLSRQLSGFSYIGNIYKESRSELLIKIPIFEV